MKSTSLLIIGFVLVTMSFKRYDGGIKDAISSGTLSPNQCGIFSPNTAFRCRLTYENNRCGFYGSAKKVYIENTDPSGSYLVTVKESNNRNNEIYYHKEKVGAGETSDIGCTETGSQGSATLYFVITGEQKLN